MKCAFLLLISALAAAAQSVEGDVVNAATGTPLAGAHVSAYPVSYGGQLAVKTDAAGHFQLPPSASAVFSVQVIHAGFLHKDKAILLKPGQTPAALHILLIPAAAISGKIDDEDGFPVGRAQVQALRYRMVNGERQLQAAASTESDDLGRYRLANLPAGHYWIRTGAGDAANWDRRYVPEFFPGTLQQDDTNRVDLETGQERNGLDIHLTKYEGVTVSGRIEMPAGAAASPRMPFLSLQRNLFGWPDMFTGSQRNDGSFTIRHVPPGNYVLRASAGNAADFLGEQKLQVGDSDVEGIVIAVHEVQAVDLAGTVVMESGGSAPAVTIGLYAQAGGSARTISVRPGEDGSFVFKGVLPGHYGNLQVIPNLSAASGAATPAVVYGYPVSARLGDTEVLQTGFDLAGPPAGPLRITLRSRMLEIPGKLLDASGAPVAGADLVLIGTGGVISAATTHADGTFAFSARQPGDVRVYLADDPDNYADLDYLKDHENDFPMIHVVEGTNPPLTLRLPRPAK